METNALNLAGQVHYQIYNGGFAQMMGNGYADEIEDIGYSEFLTQLASDLNLCGYENESKEYKNVFGAMSYVVKILSNLTKSKCCDNCDGSGYVEYENEETDEDGETYSSTEEETCDYCNGDGYIDVDRFDECDCNYVDDYDSVYYSEFDGDVIDDVTEQSHNHSVFLDAIEGD